MNYEELTSGLLRNHHQTFDAIDYNIGAGYPVSGDYSNGEAIECTEPNADLMVLGEFEPTDLSGFYFIRVFMNGSGYSAHDPIGELEVYKDGEKVDYTGHGDANVDGELIIPYTGTTACGCRFGLWFDPKSYYTLNVKTKSLCEESKPVILEYIKLDQIQHFNPLMTWVNASEETGGDLWAFDVGTDTVTGDGDTSKTKTISTTYDFKQIYFADAMPITGSNLNATIFPGGIGTSSVEFAFSKSTNWSNTYTFLWFIIGIVELPVVRPL
jgi:hypothetical protein